MSLRARFLDFDDALAAHGVPPLTAWWRDGIGRWLDAYEHGHVLELWACVGRGSSKSTALYKLAAFFAVFGDFVVPPGERHFAIVLSRLKEEAAKGIAIIDRWLSVLHVPHHVAGDVIELADLPRGIRVVAASVAAASGWRAFFVGRDERSKWPVGGVADEDASEIDTSATAMTATHAFAPVVSVGSAWGAAGDFYDAITGGTDAGRVTLGPTPTWIAAPHISEADTRRKERDPRRWAREYQCCFQSGAGSAFSAEETARLPRALSPTAFALGTGAAFIDSSAGRGDGWPYCLVQHVLDVVGSPIVMEERTTTDFRGVPSTYIYPKHDAEGRQIPNPDYVRKRRLYIDGQGAFEGKFGETIPFPVPVARVAALSLANGITRVFGDQFMSYALTAEFAKHGMTFVELPWTAPSKIEAAAMLRNMLADQSISAHPGDETTALVADLLELQEVMTKTGAITVQARRTRRGHADRGMLALLIARAESLGLISGSAIAPSRRCSVWDAYGPND